MLQINFDEADLSITEGAGNTLSIIIRYRNIQNPFNLTIRPVSIDQAANILNVSIFIPSEIVGDARATPGG